MGSKAWLVSQAFNGPENGNGNNLDGGTGVNERCIEYDGKSELRVGNDRLVNSNDYPEDKFHIKLPPNVNQYTGLRMDEENGNESKIEDIDFYPEDSFHKRDASSSYIISQREEKIKGKWAKHEKYVLIDKGLQTILRLK